MIIQSPTGGAGLILAGAGDSVRVQQAGLGGSAGILSYRSLSFDGGDDYVSVTNHASLQGTTNTIMAWIKTSNAGASYRSIAQKELAWAFGLKDNVFSTYDWAGVGDISSGVNLADGTWHHVAFVRQVGVANGSSLWVDGTQRGSSFTYSSNTQTANVAIGRNNTTTGTEYFSGLIDEVAIFNVALSGAEVLAIYQNTSSAYPSGLVGNWIHADEGSGTTTADSSGNGNTGTLVNGVAWSTDVPAALA